MNSKFQNFSRRQGLGGSDIAAVFGLSPFKSPVQLWAEKRGLVEPPAGVAALHLRLGQHLEPFIAAEFERQTGLKTHSHLEALVHPAHPMFYGHIDRFVTEPGAPAWDGAGRVCATTLLECKSAHAFAHDQWGEAGSDQMPAAYLLQVVWYLAITGCSRAVVAVLLGNQRFACYEVLRDRALEGLVLDRCKRFWEEHVLAGVPPEPSREEDLRLIFPKDAPDACLEADDALCEALERYRNLLGAIREQEGRAEALKLTVLTAMGSAQTLTHRGQVLATWKQAKPAVRVDVAALEAAHPELIAPFKRPVAGARRFLLKPPPAKVHAHAPDADPIVGSRAGPRVGERVGSRAGLSFDGVSHE